MTRKTLILAASFGIVLILTRLPVFPLVTEAREFSQDGESLFQEWSLVPMGEFYDAARFARTGWLETTWQNYLILFAVNHAGLLAVFFVCRRILEGVFSWKKSPA